MKYCSAFISVLLAAVYALSPAGARDMDAVVTTDWLFRNLENESLVMVDIRNASQYSQGHVPGSFNVPLSSWAVPDNGLSLQVPSENALKDLLGKLGIAAGSRVIVVGRSETDFGRADMTRVAWTIALFGIKNVAVLDGGYTKWARENRPISTTPAVAKTSSYLGRIDSSTIVSKAYVLSRIGKSTIADTRIPEEYFGVKSKPGHIKGAVNLPTPWVFNADGTFKNADEIRAMAAGVLGVNKSAEIIVYCGVGGYASTWWFLLTQVLGYTNVKLYDGSMEEWILDTGAPVDTYTWR